MEPKTELPPFVPTDCLVEVSCVYVPPARPSTASTASTASLLLCSERLMTEIPIERAFGAGICRIECKLRIASDRRKREFLLRDTEDRRTEREHDRCDKGSKEKRKAALSVSHLCHLV